MDFDGNGLDGTDGVEGDAGLDDALDGPSLSVTVDGVSGDYAATTDLDGDGIADTVHVEGEDGSYDYTDTSGDGVADTLVEYDADGAVSARATYDAAGGGWREVAPDQRHTMLAEPGARPEGHAVDSAPDDAGPAEVGPDGGPGAGGPTPDGPGTIMIDAPGGPAEAGTASYDTTGDGILDTAVATTQDGSTVVVSDLDGDGSADYVTEVGADGTYTSFEHTGAAEWTVVDRGTLGGDGPAGSGG